jgi:adenylate cyclase
MYVLSDTDAVRDDLLKKQQGQAHEVRKTAIIGRLPSCDFRVDDSEVSKEHCVVVRVGNDYIVRDLDSSNGTFVNNRRVRDQKLRDADVISIGNTCIAFDRGQLWVITDEPTTHKK